MSIVKTNQRLLIDVHFYRCTRQVLCATKKINELVMDAQIRRLVVTGTEQKGSILSSF
jgi:hypothetical protein